MGRKREEPGAWCLPPALLCSSCEFLLCCEWQRWHLPFERAGSARAEPGFLPAPAGARGEDQPSRLFSARCVKAPTQAGAGAGAGDRRPLSALAPAGRQRPRAGAGGGAAGPPPGSAERLWGAQERSNKGLLGTNHPHQRRAVSPRSPDSLLPVDQIIPFIYQGEISNQQNEN